jgi:hypothetical protein
MTLTKDPSEPTLRISRGSSCLKSKQKAVASSRRRRGVKLLLLVAKELKMNVPPAACTTTREDTLHSMNTRRRFKRRGSKSSSMMMVDLAALSEVSVECTTHTTESIHQQKDSRNGFLVSMMMREINEESFCSLATYDTSDSSTTEHFLHT